jgi:hypothetical protein
VAGVAENPTAPGGEHGLDIIVFVAHLGLSSADVDGLISRMLNELNWKTTAAAISLIVSDKLVIDRKLDPYITLIPASEAAAAFRDRCRVLESAPHDVLISFGEYLPSTDTIGGLRLIARSDELMSAVAPRIGIGPNGELLPLRPRNGSNMSGMIDAKYVSALAHTYYFPEILCPCLLLSSRMIGNIDVPDEFDYFPDVILAFLRAGRRRGLLVRIENRITVPTRTNFDAEALQHDTVKMLQRFDDFDLAARRIAIHTAYSDEDRFHVLHRSSAMVKGSLLLDCTNTTAAHSGSAEYVLGVLGGFAAIDSRSWDVAVMIGDEVRRFFSLDERFPTIRFAPESDNSFYDCAIRLSQAWSMSTLVDLNRRARSIAVTILDTIGPDVIYAAPQEGAEEAFQFAAKHADGLIYISEFSRSQFKRRFVTRSGLMERIIYLSLDPAEYAPAASVAEEMWILIFGNALDHKDLERTTRIVSAAFPYEQIKVVGRGDLSGMNVEAFDSGALKNEFVSELFERAKCIVFPSFYEGFGLPLIRGLACGKTVVARRSAVFREILAKFPDIGRFVEFENSLELVSILGDLLQNKGRPASSLERRPSVAVLHGWSQCAVQILEFAQQMRGSEDIEVWRERDRVFRYLKSKRFA